MRFLTFFLSALVLAAPEVSSALVGRRSPSVLGIIQPRQDPTTTVCTSTCAPFEATLTTCTTLACLCTSANSANLQACINCSVIADPTVAVIDDANVVLNDYDATCLNFNLPVVTVPVPTGSATLATSSGADTSTSTSAAGAIFPLSSQAFSQITIRPTSTTLSGSMGPSNTVTTTSPSGSGNPLVKSGSSTTSSVAASFLLIGVGFVVGMNLL